VFTGIDDVGVVNNITNIISADLNVNMKSISFNQMTEYSKGVLWHMSEILNISTT